MPHSDNEPSEIPSLTLGDDEIRSHTTLNPHRPVQTGKTKSTGTTNPALWLILLLLLCITLAGGYTGWQQLKQLEQALTLAQQQAITAQAQLQTLQQRLDGELASSQATNQASTDAVGAKLKESNSEIRKLWDLANKRNRPAIAKLSRTLEEQEKVLKQLQQELNKSQGRLEQLSQQGRTLDTLKEQQSAQNKKFAQLQSANDVTLALLQEQLQNLDRQQQSISQQQKQLDQRQQALADKSQAFDDAVRSLDSYRQQINRQLQSIQQQLQQQ